jgi:hypothetical protein
VKTNELRKTIAPATFLGIQETIGTPSIPLYNLWADVPGLSCAGSTVSRASIERAGLLVAADQRAKEKEAQVTFDAARADRFHAV